jgi:hypothetical protein
MLSLSSRRTRRIALFVIAALGVTLFAFYKRSSSQDKALVFAMMVQTPGGDLLASPVVVGEEGQRLQVRLMCEEDPREERMSLTLDPLGIEDGHMLYSYELSVAGRVDSEHGTVRLQPGKERRIEVRPNDPKGVLLSLYAAPLKHPGLEKFLLLRKYKRSTIAS